KWFGGSAEKLGKNLDKASGILSTIQNFIGTAFPSMKIDELIKKIIMKTLVQMNWQRLVLTLSISS
ncbi:hypothetical protein, partial [Vibrio parahaemolyticus]|uniref:hypothetical protein n=1 Tax=Vibrio parahaemolyticus TaxID=670 RepID=UPI00053B5706